MNIITNNSNGLCVQIPKEHVQEGGHKKCTLRPNPPGRCRVTPTLPSGPRAAARAVVGLLRWGFGPGRLTTAMEYLSAVLWTVFLAKRCP